MLVHARTRCYVDENKWRAMRDGLDAEFLDFVRRRRISMRESIHETLDFVDEVVDDLGSRREMTYLRGLLDNATGTGADRQLAVYEDTHDVDKVIQFLMQQTMQGISTPPEEVADAILRFKMYETAG